MESESAKRRKSNIRALVGCACILMAFALLICNWRSSVGLRASSGNADLLVFIAAAVAIPLGLLWAARTLPPLLRGMMAVCAVILMTFAALVVFWNSSLIALMVSRGVEVTPRIATARRGSGRIAAYQVETSPAGAYVRVRLEQPLVPGLLLFRDIATVDDPDIEGITLPSPTTLCVLFSEGEPDRSGRRRQPDVLLEFGPLISWTTPALLEANSPGPLCSSEHSLRR